jgi:hypothetical protein
MLFNFGSGEESVSRQNLVYCSHMNENSIEFDYLIFVDSRGFVINDTIEFSSIYLLKTLMKKYLGVNYLIISRPKNLTVYSTLINFLNLNPKLKFKNLITNLGFVDCTPKKQNNIDDILSQIELFSKSSNIIVDHEKYRLSSGNLELLKSIKYSKDYLLELNSSLHSFKKCFFINTPIISGYVNTERKRPNSFFTQLYKTNELINNIVDLSNKNILIDISDLSYTYDGVHFTKTGHHMVFNKIKQSIGL